jgi:hypothetical protein
MRNQHCSLPIPCGSLETETYVNLESECPPNFSPEDMSSIYLQDVDSTAPFHAV